MDEPIFTAVNRHKYQPTSCPECGQRHELGWVDVSTAANMDRWSPNEKCRNQACSSYRNPNSLGGG